LVILIAQEYGKQCAKGQGRQCRHGQAVSRFAGPENIGKSQQAQTQHDPLTPGRHFLNHVRRGLDIHQRRDVGVFQIVVPAQDIEIRLQDNGQWPGLVNAGRRNPLHFFAENIPHHLHRLRQSLGGKNVDNAKRSREQVDILIVINRMLYK
jgi:hypothetical protein